MKKILFALIICFPLFFKLDSFAAGPYFHLATFDVTPIYDDACFFVRVPGSDGRWYSFFCGRPGDAATGYYRGNRLDYGESGSYGGPFEIYNSANVFTFETRQEALDALNLYVSTGVKPSVSGYDSSIQSGLLWHNSFYLGSEDTYEVVSFSHTLSGNVLNGDNKSTILEIYVNDVQKDVITKSYNPLNSVFDGINFHHSDYGINNGDTIRVRAYYYLNNNYGNYKEISWIAKNKLDNDDNLITNPSGEHGGGGSERNPIETTIKNPYVPSTPSGQPPQQLAPIQTTITQQQVIEVNPSTEETVTVQNIYIQGYEIPEYPNYEDQLKTIEELLKGVNSGDTITNITNNYEYTYNYNFDFDIDFGDLNLNQQDLKSFIQDFPAFSEEYISFLSSFGVPVWLVVLIISCFALIFVALFIKIVKLVLPI